MMSFLRSYLPETFNESIMFYSGRALCWAQYYLNNTFSASEITERLYVGDLASASNFKALKDQGITHIVTVINGAYELYPGEFQCKIIHVNDDPWVDISQYFDETNAFIDDALSQPNTKVMIHCQRGVSRSVTLLLAYLLTKQNEEKVIPKEEVDSIVEKTLSNVKAHRPVADPNTGFIDSLKKYIYKKNCYELV